MLAKDLGAKLVVFVEEHSEEYRKSKFVAGGDFLDQKDLEEAYKDKPEQLQSIYENSRSFVCPVKKCTMWQNPVYKARATLEAPARLVPPSRLHGARLVPPANLAPPSRLYGCEACPASDA